MCVPYECIFYGQMEPYNRISSFMYVVNLDPASQKFMTSKIELQDSDDITERILLISLRLGWSG